MDETSNQKEGTPSRALPWAEQSPAQQIESLRDAVRTLRHSLRSLSHVGEVAYRANAMVQAHEHGANGLPVFPARVFEARSGSVSSGRDPLA